ncbi:DUF6624 domain-containing protein [Paraferrimonas sedimenticola]|uniref:Uncharacterized protein n=1 Tax=Paraferrimonas sedimenticola TaxID=375674 RepID=A0AA37RZT2_9GAMM|nr:DUF6624 domain-containing protein [Paraferrimonas sedimenticola]GLP98039.1 hypothetical protein GCM10007895_33460 [Paraferrimonas sedimenticola]
MRFFYTVICLVFISNPSLAASNPDLKRELEQMVRVDQEIRSKIGELGWHNPPKDLLERMNRIDSENTRKLKQIIDRHAWPTRQLVGSSGVSAAFLVIQHSPDYEFKAKMLPTLKQSYLRGEGIEGQDIALLTDRILIHRGEKQLYGTQLNILDGIIEVKPLLEPENVDKRRAELGMPALEEYKKLVSKAYGMAVK